MRIFLILFCSLAIACAVDGAQENNKARKPAPKKNQAPLSQHAAAASRAKKATPTHYQAAKATHYQKPKAAQHVTTAGGRSTAIGANKTKEKTKVLQQIATQSGEPAGGKLQKTKRSQQVAAGRYTASSTYSQKRKQLKGGTTSVAAFQSSSKTYKVQHFNLSTKSKLVIAPVTFNASRHIEGSER